MTVNVIRLDEYGFMENPYTPPSVGSQSDNQLRAHRSCFLISCALAACAVAIALIHLPPFLRNNATAHSSTDWAIEFAPPTYLLIASVSATIIERYRNRVLTLCIPIILFPLILFTAYIIYHVSRDPVGVFSLDYPIIANVNCALLVFVCPLIWYYLGVSSFRSSRLIRRNYSG